MSIRNCCYYICSFVIRCLFKLYTCQMPMSRQVISCLLYGRWTPSDAIVLTWMAIGKNVFLWNCYCTRVATWPLAQLCAWGISSHRPSGVASDLTLFLPTAVKHILSNEDKGTALEQLIDQFLIIFTKRKKQPAGIQQEIRNSSVLSLW